MKVSYLGGLEHELDPRFFGLLKSFMQHRDVEVFDITPNYRSLDNCLQKYIDLSSDLKASHVSKQVAHRPAFVIGHSIGCHLAREIYDNTGWYFFVDPSRSPYAMFDQHVASCSKSTVQLHNTLVLSCQNGRGEKFKRDFQLMPTSKVLHLRQTPHVPETGEQIDLIAELLVNWFQSFIFGGASRYVDKGETFVLPSARSSLEKTYGEPTCEAQRASRGLSFEGLG